MIWNLIFTLMGLCCVIELVDQFFKFVCAQTALAQDRPCSAATDAWPGDFMAGNPMVGIPENLLVDVKSLQQFRTHRRGPTAFPVANSRFMPEVFVSLISCSLSRGSLLFYKSKQRS